MSNVLVQGLRNFSWPHAALKKQKQAVPASHHVKPSDALRDSLFWLVQNVAERCAPNTPPFDTNKMTKALQARLEGGELNLCNLDAEETSFFETLTLDDWKQLHVATTLRGAIGIAYIEIEADLLDRILPGLKALSNLDCVSVWAPPEGGDVDFGFLKGANGPLRINILGTPNNPLKITAFEGANIEARESQNPAIQNSVFHTRDASGQVSAESTPLPLARPLMAPANALQETALDDLSIGLKILMRCGSFDTAGRFGFDLKNLLPEQVRLVQKLGDPLWSAIEADASKAGLRIGRIECHKDLRIDLELMPSLKKLSSFVTISFPTPPPPFTVESAARKFLKRCRSIDAQGRLGLDSTKLSKEEAVALQLLGPNLWKALQAEAKEAGLQIKWLNLHDNFVVSRPLVLALKELETLETLSVATPARGILLNLGQLQGGSVCDVEVRCGSRKWAIIVPEGVNVRPSREPDESDVALRQSKVHYERDSKIIREALLFESPPTKV